MNNHREFLKDVILCTLSCYGGPSAHYGIFTKILVEEKKYITKEELLELMGLFSLFPGPSSTQTLTAIGYHVGGKKIAFYTLMIWIFPALMILSLFGIGLGTITNNQSWQWLLRALPVIAMSFMVYGSILLLQKSLTNRNNIFLFIIILVLGYFLVPLSSWFIPLLLVGSGMSIYLLNKPKSSSPIQLNFNKGLLILFGFISILNEVIRHVITSPLILLLTSFYRYGYWVIGGGQIMIPMMINDFVQHNHLISQADFLAGYAIDQIVPGPLFSFVSFVGAKSTHSFLVGILSGLMIFLPGTLIVYLVTPLWKKLRQTTQFKPLLLGITIASSALMALTIFNQFSTLSFVPLQWIIFVLMTLTLFIKKIPTPLIVIVGILLHLFI